MTEELKYKVGDKVLIEVEVHEVDDTSIPYRLEIPSGHYLGWVSEEVLEMATCKLPPKPKVTQSVMGWYEKDYPNEEEKTIDEILDKFANTAPIDSDVTKWLFHHTCGASELNKRQHALATLITYGPEAVEVEEEKRCLVTLKATGQLLKKYKGKYIFDTSGSFKYLPKQELIEAGFGDVFDNPMFEVEEVE